MIRLVGNIFLFDETVAQVNDVANGPPVFLIWFLSDRHFVVPSIIILYKRKDILF